MKRVMMAVAALAISATMNFAYSQNVNKEPFTVSVKKLSAYLDLAPSQYNQVSEINEIFTVMQNESLAKRNPARKEKAMTKAVYGNLKLMKEALTKEQYRKYVALINVTNNNLHIIDAANAGNMAYNK